MMTSTNILIASFYSFLIHAGLFLGFFGYFEQTAKPNKILSSPLSVKMLVEDLTPVSYTHLTLPTNREV